MPTIQVNGQTIFYETYGQGQPLLLMHGWTQIGRDLRDVAESLAVDYRVILPDMPGYGRSVPPYRTFPPDFYRRDALLMGALLDALHLSTVHIMGFSDGGEVALLLPALRPNLCRSVVAWGAIGLFDPFMCEVAQRTTLQTVISDTMRAKHPGQRLGQWPQQWVEAFGAMIESGDYTTASMIRASQITCPLLMILGSQDTLNPADYGRKFLAAVASPDKILDVFTGVGHFVHTERPQQFLAAVQRFLFSQK
ncbi:MAG: alpha/beta hydrolase [Anaerolineae bacterium]|nr:alpha/beta hydrolase [Anaerolineae bacterium]